MIGAGLAFVINRERFKKSIFVWRRLAEACLVKRRLARPRFALILIDSAEETSLTLFEVAPLRCAEAKFRRVCRQSRPVRIQPSGVRLNPSSHVLTSQ